MYEMSLLLTHVNPINSMSVLILKLPTLFNSRVQSCSPSPCTITPTRVTFSSLSTSLIVNTISITLQIINPLTLGSTLSFQAYTLQSSLDTLSVIDEITSGMTTILTSRRMSPSDVTLTTSSDIVYNYPSQFRFIINNNNDLPAYSYITVAIPS